MNRVMYFCGIRRTIKDDYLSSKGHGLIMCRVNIIAIHWYLNLTQKCIVAKAVIVPN